ncbi:MAG: alanine--tRNA ligase [Ignisphaera sp.]
MSIADTSVFRVRLFSSRGHLRQECNYCKSYFWSTMVRDDCGDFPCTDYTFLNISSKKRSSYKEVRNLFLEFFKKRGHEVIEPKPVVARWREDLYLTIASIVVFQPHVTSGLVPPPANPLVIAQPCIRLEDIDSIGHTFGRHLTNFIMGGHHAFNYKDKFVYWTDETVEYAYEFFVEELGIPEDEVTFKESWWEGGGNAGPCFEVSVGGLELATLVFMMYKATGNDYEELPLKIVDTGYGIERIAWFLQKTPTAFHAVYGELLSEFHKVLSLPEPKRDILMATLLNLSKAKSVSRDTLYTIVAQRLGISAKDVEEQLVKVFDLYAILDHTKTIALMLSDGIVPSNSGEGYLARLVIRKTLRKLNKLNKEIKLAELIARQLSYWSDMYPNMARARDRVLEMVELEEERYRGVLSRVSAIVSKFSSRPPGIDELVEIYDSHGIPPEILVEEIEKRYGKEVEVPENFYSIVASRHSRPKILKEVEEVRLPKDVVEWASRYSSTEHLFHIDQYVRRFKARVLGVYEKYVVLDRSAFYPEGGGQLGDRGYLYIDGKALKVLDTKKVNDVVVHVVDSTEGLSDGVEVEGEIDWVARYRRMRHHTATHILLGAIRRVLGDHVWQAGAEKTELKARLDVTHYKMLTDEEITKIEELANNIVDNAIDVRIQFLPRNDAEKLYGFTLYQGGVPMTPTIRVVEIPGWDAQACFGTHVKNTSEVGAIKIVNVEKIADGIVRFEYTVATAVPLYAHDLENKLQNIAKALNVSSAEVDKRIPSFVKELNDIKSMLKTYRSLYINETLNAIKNRLESLDKVKLYIHRVDVEDKELLKEIALKAIEQEPELLFIGLIPQNNKTYIEISLGKEAVQKVDAKQLIEQISKEIPIKAGGKRDHITGIIDLETNRAEEMLRNRIKQYLEKQS